MTETKPEGLTALERWAWDNTEPGSWGRQALGRIKEQEKRQKASPVFRLRDAVQEARRQIEARGYYVPPAHLTERARARSPLFVRFGSAPEGGRSTTHAGPRGGLEPGVCVFRARREGPGVIVVDVSESPLLMAEFYTFLNAGRPAFYATGEEVEPGTGGEPCLKDPRLKPVEGGARILASGEWWGRGIFELLGRITGCSISVLDKRPDLRERLGSSEKHDDAPTLAGPNLNEMVDAMLESWGHKDLADERRQNRWLRASEPPRNRTRKRRRLAAAGPELGDGAAFWESPAEARERTRLEHAEREMRREQRRWDGAMHGQGGYGWT